MATVTTRTSRHCAGHYNTQWWMWECNYRKCELLLPTASQCSRVRLQVSGKTHELIICETSRGAPVNELVNEQYDKTESSDQAVNISLTGNVAELLTVLPQPQIMNCTSIHMFSNDWCIPNYAI